jgi:hypothetical protein
MNYVNRSPSPVDPNDEEYPDNDDVVIQAQLDDGNNNTSDKDEFWDEQPDLKKEMREYVRHVIQERLQQGDIRNDLEGILEERLSTIRSETQSRMSATKHKK